MTQPLKQTLWMLLLSISPLIITSCGNSEEESNPRSVKITMPQLQQEGVCRSYPAVIKESNETGLGFSNG